MIAASLSPYIELAQMHFDIIIVGIGIRASICAAQAARAGKRVLVVSDSHSYGHPLYASSLPTADALGSSGWRVDAAPLVLSAAGPVVEALLEYGAAEYVRFEAPKGIVLISDDKGSVRKWPVPLSKEAVMLDAGISVQDKRHLMKALSDQSLDHVNDKIRGLVQHALDNPADMPFELGTFVSGLGRYDRNPDRCTFKTAANAPYLVPVYGASDIAQAFCRVAAVHGAIFVMAQQDIRVHGNTITATNDGCEWSANAAEIVQLIDDEAEACSSFVLATASPLDEAGCWLYRLPHNVGLLQLDTESGRCPPGHYLFHAWSSSLHESRQSVRIELEKLFDFDGSDPLKPEVLWHEEHRIGPPITSACAERTLLLSCTAK